MEPIEIQRRVEAVCVNFREETGVSVPEPARTLIANSLLAIEYDPHPSWTNSSEERSRFVVQYLENLPTYLRSVQENELRIAQRGEYRLTELTYFGVVHWSSS